MTTPGERLQATVDRVALVAAASRAAADTARGRVGDVSRETLPDTEGGPDGLRQAEQ